jgi:SAD/SRA domain
MANVGHAGAVPGRSSTAEAIRAAGLHRHGMRRNFKDRGRPGGSDRAQWRLRRRHRLGRRSHDDIDLGDEVTYTGEGGRDATTKTHVSDQALTGGNAALENSLLEGSPVRVFRKTGTANDYRYDGL